MTDATIGQVEAAIRYRNISHRIVAVLLSTGAVAAIGAAAADSVWDRDRQSLDAAAASAGLGWSEIATAALGYFSLAVLIAMIVALIYELIIARHVRQIARQVRGRTWLERPEAIRLRRGWFGASDDLDVIVAALNGAREHGIDTRSALTWQIAEHYKAGQAAERRIEELERENASLARESREQAEYAAGLVARLADPASVVAEAASAISVGAPDMGNVRHISGGGASTVAGAAATVNELAEELADFAAAAGGWPCMEALSLEEVVEDVVEDMPGLLSDAGVTVEISDLPAVRGDAALLARLFRSLIRRVAMAAPSDRAPVVRIRGLRRDGHVLVMVADNVTSASDESADSADAPGICRRIVHSHRGELSVQPVPSGGCVVEMTFHPA